MLCSAAEGQQGGAQLSDGGAAGWCSAEWQKGGQGGAQVSGRGVPTAGTRATQTIAACTHHAIVHCRLLPGAQACRRAAVFQQAQASNDRLRTGWRREWI